MLRSSQRGFSLAECLVGCGLAAALLLLATPRWTAQHDRANRLQAAELLLRLQAEQEKHRAAVGRYAPSLQALPAVAAAPGLQSGWQLSLVPLDDGFQATARHRSASRRGDRCEDLTLQVRHGFATRGPDARCWP